MFSLRNQKNIFELSRISSRYLVFLLTPLAVSETYLSNCLLSSYMCSCNVIANSIP